MVDEGDDHYATLGVTPGANARTIRAAYKALAQRCHPDKAGGADPDAMARMLAVNEACRVLGDPRRRAQYDQLRARQRRDTDGDANSGRHTRRKRRRAAVGPTLFAEAMQQLIGLLLMLLMFSFLVFFVAMLFVPWPVPERPDAATAPLRPPAEPKPLYYE
jgi:hypothetical protein